MNKTKFQLIGTIILLISFLFILWKYINILQDYNELSYQYNEIIKEYNIYKNKENKFKTLYNKIYSQTQDRDKTLYLSVCISNVLNEVGSQFEFINEDLIISIIKVESDFDRVAVSNVGAIGYMQVKQSTADWLYKKFKLKVKPELYKTYNNIYYGVYYLNYLANKLKNKYPKSILPALVLLAYNEGPNSTKVRRMSYNGHRYINKVLNIYQKL